MKRNYYTLPCRNVKIDINKKIGELELWRHTLGLGGCSSKPLPDSVINGVKALKPHMIRIFIQEFFYIYPEHGQFDWSRLDPYMDALARTGASIVAAITIKPKVLYPIVDQSIWRPNDVDEWQNVIYQLVKRYSVDKQIVTHWEAGNETDFGDNGGCPYLVGEPDDYFEYYNMMIKPILDAYPQAKVGGPVAGWVENAPMEGFIELCRKSNTRLDFISWHSYCNNPQLHAQGIQLAKRLIEGFHGVKPETFITEWNINFNNISSVADCMNDPFRAANIAFSILSMIEAGLDWSFYYHIYDQTSSRKELGAILGSEAMKVLYRVWNEAPIYFGLFGDEGEVRLQYFLFKMLSLMDGKRLESNSDCSDINVLASYSEDKIAAFIVNFNLNTSQDMIIAVDFSNLKPGLKYLKVYRIDDNFQWSPDSLEMSPVEKRKVDIESEFHCQILSPGDSVSFVTIEDIN